jgi:signal transduction histidine kinase
MGQFSWLSDLILRLRWVLMSLLGGLIVFYELNDHGVEAVQELKINFLFEALVMGFILPLLGGILLTKLMRSRVQYAKKQEHLSQRKLLFSELLNQDWNGLKKFIVQYPGTILPVEHTSLYVYDHRLARLEFVADWYGEKANSPPCRDPSFKICQACLLSKETPLRPAIQCPFVLESPGNRLSREFCLALSYDKVLVAILRLRCRPCKTLAPEQIDFLNEMAPEIALSLVLALAHPRQMARVRMQTQFMERQRMAIDLHNVLSQQIGYLHLNLDRLAHDDQLLISDRLKSELERMRHVANETYVQVRNTLALLHSWESVDLTQAIEDHYRKVARRARLSNVFTTAGDPVPLPPEISRQIFSLLQEGLNNIEKHARAKNFKVSLTWTAECLIMSIDDDGVGFDPLSVQSEGHYGLMMMREIVEAMQGELEVDSSYGQGTRLSFRIPLPHVQANPKRDQALPV